MAQFYAAIVYNMYWLHSSCIYFHHMILPTLLLLYALQVNNCLPIILAGITLKPAKFYSLFTCLFNDTHLFIIYNFFEIVQFIL